MKKQDEADALRRAAEAYLETTQATGAPAPGAADLPRLAHELQVSGIELEMQNNELRQTRDELEAALTRYTELYDFAPVGYFTFDRCGIICQVNLAGARLLAADRALLLGRRFAGFVASAARPAFAGLLERAFASQRREVCTVALLGEDSSAERPFVHIEVEVGSDGETCRAVMTDLSATQQAEEALREREASLSSILEATPDMVCTVDRQLRIQFTNRAPAGLSLASVLGTDVTAYITPEYQALARHGIGQVFATGRIGRFELQARCEHDVPSWYETVAAPVYRAGEVIAVTLLSRDIEQRKRSDDKLRQLSLAVEQTPLSIVITDLDGSIEYANAAYTATSGYAIDEALGKNPRFHQSGQTPRETYQALWQTLARGQTWSGEFINRRKNGEDYVEFAIITPVRQADGRATHYIAIKEDVTERKRIRAELDPYSDHLEELVTQRAGQIEELNRQLEQRVLESEAASRAKSAFLANMSHEIRTPISVIIGIAHLLRRDLGDPAQKQRLELLCASSEHLLAIINDVLDLSKIEAERLTLDDSDFILEAVVHKMLRMLEEPAQEKGLTLTAEVAPRLHSMLLHGDALRLAQVLINLCGNAVKFTEHGGVRLSIACLAESTESVVLRFTVEDSGIGIAPADQARLFQPFMQADNSPTRERGGTGLGLVISQHLVAMMGGTIVVDSSPRTGSRFSFELALPRADARSVEAAVAVPASSFAGRKILFAEDHPLIQEILLEMLEDLGCEVDVAADGAEAVECARARNYDFILMDVRMPRMDGLAATRAIRQLPGHRATPIVALTANAFAEDRQCCLDAGMNGHLGKPVTPAELAAVIGQWLPDLAVSGPPTAAGDNELSRAVTKIPGLDPGPGVQRSPQQLADYCSLLKRFLTQHGQDMRRLREHLAAGEHDAAHVVAHNLKGIAGLVGARTVAALAGEIVQELSAGAPARGIVALAGACEAELASLAEALRTLPGQSPESAAR